MDHLQQINTLQTALYVFQFAAVFSAASRVICAAGGNCCWRPSRTAIMLAVIKGGGGRQWFFGFCDECPLYYSCKYITLTSVVYFACELIVYCVPDRLEMYINFSLYLLQLNSWPVPTSKATVTANTVIVLCVRPVRNVHKCQSILITTEQLTSTDQ